MKAALKAHEDAKIWGGLRGHKTYKKAGEAMEALKTSFLRMKKIESETNNINHGAYEQALKRVRDDLKKLAAANKAYFNHKKEDGQWGPNNTNEKAKRRIAAVEKMNSVVEPMRKMIEEKLADLKKLDQNRMDNKKIDYEEKISEAQEYLIDEAQMKKQYPNPSARKIREQYATIIAAYQARIQHNNTGIEHTEKDFKALKQIVLRSPAFDSLMKKSSKDLYDKATKDKSQNLFSAVADIANHLSKQKQKTEPNINKNINLEKKRPQKT